VKSLWIGVVLTTLVVASTVAEAADEARLQDQITQYNVILADLKKADTGAVATAEFAKLQSWITQAQTKLATGDDDDVEIIVRRFKPQVGLVRAMLKRAKTSVELQRMREDDQTFREEARRLESRAKELEKRRRELKDAVEARRPGRGGLRAPSFGGGGTP